MARIEPWNEKWECLEEMSKGGQGVTFRARSRTEPEHLCVLKLLRNNSSPQARRRMAREIVNLATVHQAGGRVPQILDHNASTENVADTKIPLYLAMQFVEGETLRQFVEHHGPLPLSEALSIVRDICATVRIAHSESVLHRDIKPENVVVKPNDGEPLAFIVDYGLSFNTQADEDLTRSDEQFGNKFLFLPDSFGQDQRDPRSDLTAIAGLLFYALTKQVPGQLRDGNGRMPHQRYPKALHSTDEVTAHQLRTFFSKAFAYEFNLRFQTVDDLLARLDELGTPNSIAAPEDPVVAATRAKELLHRHGRPTILARFRKSAAPIQAALSELTKGLEKSLREQEVKLLSSGVGGLKWPAGVDQVFSGHPIIVQLVNYSDQRAIQIVVGSLGEECIVYRVFHTAKNNNWMVGTPEEMLKYPGNDDPPVRLIVLDTRTQISRLLIPRLILP